MRERLEASRTVLIRATSAFTEADAVLNERRSLLVTARAHAETTPDNARVAAELRRVERGVADATQARTAAVERRKEAAARLVQAQADFDSTRDGLTELRAALDADPDSEMLIERYHEARATYEAEAARRERSYGHQCPLSQADLPAGGGLGRELHDLGVTAWMKGADAPTARSGLYEHRINLVRRCEGKRRSATIPFLSAEPLGEPKDDGVRLDGEPSLSEVARQLEQQINRVGDLGDFKTARVKEGVKNTPAERHSWRASVEAARAVAAFLA